MKQEDTFSQQSSKGLFHPTCGLEADSSSSSSSSSLFFSVALGCFLNSYSMSMFPESRPRLDTSIDSLKALPTIVFCFSGHLSSYFSGMLQHPWYKSLRILHVGEGSLAGLHLSRVIRACLCGSKAYCLL